jgi:D-amino-acid dehydrogenase
MKVIVLGAGVVGTATAYYLAKLGCKVEVVERQPAAAMETSRANGGVIHVSEVQPWAQPGMPSKIIGWLGQEDAPLLLRKSAVPRMWRWGLDFTRNCTAAKARAHSLTNLRLAILSLKSLQEIRGEHDIDYDVSTAGALKIYTNKASMESATSLGAEWAKRGLTFQTMSVAECVAKEPALAEASSNLVGGLFFPGEEIGDPNKFTQGLARVCESMGVVFRYGITVKKLVMRKGRFAGVETTRGEFTADAVVVAMGSFSAELLRSVGVHVSIYPVKGITVTVDAAPWPGAPKCAVIDDGRLFGLVPIGDRLRVSGSAEITGFDATPSRARCQAVVDNVISVFPSFAKCYDPDKANFWAGLRPVASSGVPYLGASAIPNLFVNAGHGHCGWTMGCGSGRVVASLVAGRSPDIDVNGLTPATH